MLASIIIPAFNAQKTIHECTKALLSQVTPANVKYEIIVVDDGSTDGTAGEIKKIKSSKVHYFYQKNSGPAKARNAGAKKARGEIILFIDSDCIVEKKWLAEMLAPFRDKKIAAVQGAYKTRQKELAARFGQIEIEQRYEKMKKARALDWVGSYSAAYRTEVFREMKGFDEGFPIASGEDPELSYKIQEAEHKIAFNPKAIVYHTHPNTLGKYLRTKFFRAYYRPKMYSKHKGKMLKDSYTPQALKLQILCFYAMIFAAILSPISKIFILLFLLALLLHILLGAGLFFFALKKDRAVAFASPVILLMRSVVFGAGLIWGKLHG